MLKTLNFNKFKIFSGSFLKLIAIVTMVIDHSAEIIFSQYDFMFEPLISIGSIEVTGYYILRKIGRLSFPIFCFLITEGFIYTRNRKKYGAILLIFALISEIPFDLMVSENWFYLGKQNIYFTLFFGFLCLAVFEKINSEPYKFLALLIICATAMILKTDYGLRGVILILLIYVLRKKPAVQAIVAYPILSGGLCAFAAFLPINMYNGKRGFIKGNIFKYAIYVFYPLHIIILLIIDKII